MFSVATGEQVRVVHAAPVAEKDELSVVERLSDDGRWLLVSAAAQLSLFDVSAGEVLQTWTLPCQGIGNRLEITWHPDGQRFGVGLNCQGRTQRGVVSFTATAHFMILGPSQKPIRFESHDFGGIGRLAFGDDGKWLAVRDGSSGDALFRVGPNALTLDVRARSVSPGFKYLQLDDFRLLELETRRLVAELRGPIDAWSPDGRWAVEVSEPVVRLLAPPNFTVHDEIPYDRFVHVEGHYHVPPAPHFTAGGTALLFNRPGEATTLTRSDLVDKTLDRFAPATRLPIESAQFLDNGTLAVGRGEEDVTRPRVAPDAAGYLAVIDLARSRLVAKQIADRGLGWGVHPAHRGLHIREREGERCTEHVGLERTAGRPCSGWSRDDSSRFEQLADGVAVVGKGGRWLLQSAQSGVTVTGIGGDGFVYGAASADGRAVALFGYLGGLGTNGSREVLWLADARGRSVVLADPSLLPESFLGSTLDLLVIIRDQGARVVDVAETLAAGTVRYSERWSALSELGAVGVAADDAGARLAAYAPSSGVTLLGPRTKPRRLAGSRCDGFVEVGVSGDGRRVALTCSQSVRVWDGASGRLLLRWHVHSSTLTEGLAFSPDSDLLVVPGGGSAHVLSIPRRTRIELVLSEVERDIQFLAVSPEGFVDGPEAARSLVVYPDPERRSLPRTLDEASKAQGQNLYHPGLLRRLRQPRP